MLRSLQALGICTLWFTTFATVSHAATATSPTTRSIYLNGKDISAARSTEMKNVTIQINEQGDIFIIAPQYQVSEEDTYIPLRKYVQGLNPNQPEHKGPTQIGAEAVKVGATQPYTDSTTANGAALTAPGQTTPTAGAEGAAEEKAPSTGNPEPTDVLTKGAPAGLEKPGSKTTPP